MKTHKTIQITREMLLATSPCARGLAAVEHLLPMTFSTDPEENVDLAHELASDGNDEYASNGGLPHWYYGCCAWWVRQLVPGNLRRFDTQLSGLPGNGPIAEDFSLTCQMIAIVADILLSERGE